MSKSAPRSADGSAKAAATVVVLRDAGPAPEIFMVRRHEGTAFMGGAHVFPGGRVDASDRETASERWCDGIAGAAVRFPDVPTADAVAFHVAAARELFEEAGVLLARDAAGFVSIIGASAHARTVQDRLALHDGRLTLADIVERDGLRLALDALVPFAHWVTPPIDVRRFDTRFFLARVPPQQTPAHDETETTASVWITAAAAIARCQRDEIVLPPPTWTTLREIEPFASVDAVMAWARNRTITKREPLFLEADGRKMLLLPGDPLNPERTAEPVPAETRFVLDQGRWRAGAARA